MDVNAHANQGGTQYIAQEQHFHYHYPPTPDEIVGVPQNLPYSGTAKFVGRDTVLRQVHEQLEAEQQLAITAIQGMGGIGKTELALQYALSHYEAYPGGVCWFRGREDIATQIVEFGQTRLNLRIPKELEDLGQKLAWCWQHWQAGQVLLVLDDVVKYETVKPWLPQNDRRFRVLITTRETLGAGIARLELEVLSDAASLELLESLIGTERLQAELEMAQKLCAWVGNLPLGLELIGRYLENKPDLALSKMLERLEKKRLVSPALKNTTPEMTAQRGLKDAFDLSWEALSEPETEEWSQAQLLAGFLSLFAVAPIPWEVVEQGLLDWDEEALEDAQTRLVNLHLLSRVEKRRYQVHTLIREFCTEKFKQLSAAEQQDWIQRAIAGLKTAFRNFSRFEHWQSYEQFVPHVQEIAQQPEVAAVETIEWAQLLNRAGYNLDQQGRYGEAESLLVRSLTIFEQLLGGNHSIVASSLNNLANLYRLQGRYSEAEPLALRAIKIEKQKLGANQIAVAIKLNSLAALYQTQGRYSEAEPLFLRALKIGEQRLGANHPDVTTWLNNLAYLYYLQGRYSEAEPLFLRTIEISEQQLGANHPDVAISLNNLALLYQAQGRYSEAEPLFLRALEIGEQRLGANHLDVTTWLNNLANLYQAQGRYSEAEPLFLRALNSRERQLGADHPDVAQSLHNLAGFYSSQERYSEAEPLYIRALDIDERQSGADHPDVAFSLNGLAVLYQDQGRYSEAEALHKRSLEIRERQLGASHPAVAKSLHNLAFLYASQGRYTEAEPFYLRALSISFKKLGADHPETQTVLQNFGGFLQQLMQAEQTGQLSDHPVTQDLLRQIREGNRE